MPMYSWGRIAERYDKPYDFFAGRTLANTYIPQETKVIVYDSRYPRRAIPRATFVKLWLSKLAKHYSLERGAGSDDIDLARCAQ